MNYLSQRDMVAGSLLIDEQREHRHDAPAHRAPCPKCDRGMVTDLNGARWKCSYCGGSGKAPLVPPHAVPIPRQIPGTRRVA